MHTTVEIGSKRHFHSVFSMLTWFEPLFSLILIVAALFVEAVPVYIGQLRRLKRHTYLLLVKLFPRHV